MYERQDMVYMYMVTIFLFHRIREYPVKLKRNIFRKEPNWDLDGWDKKIICIFFNKIFFRRRQFCLDAGIAGWTCNVLTASLLCYHCPAPAAAKSLSRVQPCATPETPAYQAPRSLGLSRQEHWSGLPFPSPNHCAYLGAKKYPPQLRAGRFRSRSWV